MVEDAAASPGGRIVAEGAIGEVNSGTFPVIRYSAAILAGCVFLEFAVGQLWVAIGGVGDGTAVRSGVVIAEAAVGQARVAVPVVVYRPARVGCVTAEGAVCKV